MSVQQWRDSLTSARKMALIHDGKRKIHYVFTDGKEMSEEYDLKTDLLISRRWRCGGGLGAEPKWQVEVGEEPAASSECDVIRENANNPLLLRRDSSRCFQWRIRNLFYPSDVYSVTVETSRRRIVVRTTNKKFYKELLVPDLDRCALPLQESSLSFSFSNNTLLISYRKPVEVLSLEEDLLKQLKRLKGNTAGDSIHH